MSSVGFRRPMAHAAFAACALLAASGCLQADRDREPDGAPTPAEPSGEGGSGGLAPPPQGGEAAAGASVASGGNAAGGSEGVIGGATSTGSSAGGSGAAPAPALSCLFEDDFGSGLGEWSEESDTSYGISVVADPLAPSNQVARFELREGDPYVYGGFRSEIAQGDHALAVLGEAWYFWRLMVDSAHDNSSDWEIVGQWHFQPDYTEGETWETTDEWVNGRPIGAVSIHDEQIFLIISNYKVGITEIRTEELPFERDRWIDVAVHFNWSQGDDGFVEIWIDGEPLAFVTEYTEGYEDELPLPGDTRIYLPTLVNSVGTNLKLGSYRNHKASSPGLSMLYDDDVRICVPE